MAIISFRPGQVIEYVPAYGGNRESKEPCVAPIKYISYGKTQDYAKRLGELNSGVSDVEQRRQIISDLQRQQFIENVNPLRGYLIDGEEVSDPKEVYETADQNLIEEILLAMQSAAALNRGQLKNLKGGSGMDLSTRKMAPDSTVKPAPDETKSKETAETETG